MHNEVGTCAEILPLLAQTIRLLSLLFQILHEELLVRAHPTNQLLHRRSSEPVARPHMVLRAR